MDHRGRTSEETVKVRLHWPLIENRGVWREKYDEGCRLRENGEGTREFWVSQPWWQRQTQITQNKSREDIERKWCFRNFRDIVFFFFLSLYQMNWNANLSYRKRFLFSTLGHQISRKTRMFVSLLSRLVSSPAIVHSTLCLSPENPIPGDSYANNDTFLSLSLSHNDES